MALANKKMGRRPPKGAPAAKFAVVRSVLPAFPSTYSLVTGLSGWEILKNDSWGDCVVVTYYTLRRIAGLLAGKDNYPPTDAQLLALYRTQNPNFDPDSEEHGPGSNDDGGMDIQTLLEMLHNDGWEDVKVVAFAKVDHTNLGEIKAALGGLPCALWLGLNVSSENQEEFDEGKPWTITGAIEGGHSTAGVEYDLDTVGMETWAAITQLADSYVTSGGTSSKTGVEEAWVVVWPEHAAAMTPEQKTAFNTSYHEVTGKDIVWPSDPTPTPEPTPTPTPEPTPGPFPPTPAPADPVAEFVAAAETWVALRHTSKPNSLFEKQVQAYLDYLNSDH